MGKRVIVKMEDLLSIFEYVKAASVAASSTGYINEQFNPFNERRSSYNWGRCDAYEDVMDWLATLIESAVRCDDDECDEIPF